MSFSSVFMTLTFPLGGGGRGVGESMFPNMCEFENEVSGVFVGADFKKGIDELELRYVLLLREG